MTDITKLKGISDVEAASLRKIGIKTVEELWVRIGKDPAGGVSEVAKDSGILTTRLTHLLAAEALQVGKWGKLKSALTIGLALVLAFVALGLLVTIVRLRSTAVVARNGLEAGRVLRSGDIYATTMAPGVNYFTSTEQITGLVLAAGVSQGEALRHEDVLRPQVVATTNITANTIIARDAVSLTWSVYQPGAAIDVEQVAGQKALYPFQSGEVILSGFITPTVIMTTSQVVVSATGGLPAFHVITATDVITKALPRQSDAFTDLKMWWAATCFSRPVLKLSCYRATSAKCGYRKTTWQGVGCCRCP